MSHKILHLISGPRNISTALMYSFAQREDTVVVDEPLYGHYLETNKEVYHPSQENYIHLLEKDSNTAIQDSILKFQGKPVTFIKNMAHHLMDIDDKFLDSVLNIFLIRDPREVILSLVNQIPEPTMRDIALEYQVYLFKKFSEEGKAPLVIDSKELLLSPASILSEVCHNVGIPFTEDMLQWEAGPRQEDGPWAPYWYHNVHKTTGFSAYKSKSVDVPEKYKVLLNRCLPLYSFLYDYSIKK